MKARRGCHVSTHFSRNHSANPYCRLAGPRVKRECIRAALALMSLLLVASCATQQESPQSSVAAPAMTPRTALTMPASPRTRASRANTVRASYQGNSTAGDRTASGEAYNPEDLTAASSTLPLGSSVIVTDPATGHSVKVRINDRSPKAHGRSLDLSKHAAEELGMTKQGVAHVKVKRVYHEPANSESHNAPAGSAETPKS